MISFGSSLRAGCLVLALLCIVAVAPAGIAADNPENELRTRANEFYAHFQAGRLNQAESYVAPESRERFRSSPARTFLGYELAACKIEPGGTSATVTVKVMMMTQFSATPVVIPHSTHWRLIDSKWYMELQAPGNQAGSGFTPGGMGQNYKTPPEELKFRQPVYDLGKLNEGESRSVRISFSNTTAHAVRVIDVYTACECLRAKTDKAEYKPGESGELTVEFHSAGYQRDYSQTIRVKTAPGDITNRVTVNAYIQPHVPDSPKTPNTRKP